MKRIIIILFSVCCLWAQETKDTLEFSHKTHINNAGAACIDCHGDVLSNTGKEKISRPKEETCRICHDDASFKCYYCDAGAENPAKLSGLKVFSHKLHLEKDKLCLSCHKGLDKTDLAGKQNMPVMDDCMACHNNKAAPSYCALCHENIKNIMPASHNQAWLDRNGHGYDAKSSQADCMKCHKQSQCNACHRGQYYKKVHPSDYKFTHGFDVNAGEHNCNKCHETGGFCKRCHEPVRR